jgi:hypothetical protein
VPNLSDRTRRFSLALGTPDTHGAGSGSFQRGANEGG